MKVNKYLFLSVASLAMASCNDYLDVLPDNRTQLDSEDKITALLVSAYPDSHSILMQEMASDNAMDNGMRYTIEAKTQEEAYRWQDITETDADTPKGFWQACYSAVATANHALQAIEKMGNPASLQAQKGEALLCRAWGHFLLANVFCLAYNPETASTDLGLPYATEPETTVKPNYERGSLADLYAKIEKDIEEGIPLINDELYTVPKYHFNKKAAYAFAARFYLYYQKWEKCIEAANQVLGTTDPTSMLRDWKEIASMASDYESRCNTYVSPSAPCNLLLQTAYSSMVYYLGPYTLGKRYGFNSKKICEVEGFRANGIWGSRSYLYMANSCWGMEQKLSISKYYGYFEFTDKVQQIGFRHNVIVQLCADETLLCRAEAYANLGQYDNAVKDINWWMSTNTSNKPTKTLDDIVKYYSAMKYQELPDGRPVYATQEYGSPKKRLHPLGFQLRDKKHECLIQCILFMRRAQTHMEGLRWNDIKRWGIVIAHNNDGLPVDSLSLNDPRRAFQLPADVVDAGLAPNPREFPKITNDFVQQ